MPLKRTKPKTHEAKPTATSELPAAFLAVSEEIRALAKALKVQLHQIYGGDPAETTGRLSALLFVKMFDVDAAKRAAFEISNTVIHRHKLVPPSHHECLSMQESFRWLEQTCGSKDKNPNELAEYAGLKPRLLEQVVDRSEQLPWLPRVTVGDAYLVMLLDHYLPTCFLELIDDLATTKSAEYRISGNLAYLLGRFTDAFRATKPVRINAIRISAFNEQIEQAHESLLKLLECIDLHRMPTKAHRVEIAINEEGRPTCSINGAPKEIGREIRTLCALALLRRKDSFSVNDFSKLYFGEIDGESDKRFDTCMAQVRPLRAAALGEGRRRLVGTMFVIEGGDDTCIERYLTEARARK